MSEHSDAVLLVEQKDNLLLLTLNRPDAANALNPELAEAILSAVNDAKGVRLCVIRGNGRHFCAGFDLSDIQILSDGDLLWRFLRIETMLQAVHHAPFPVVAMAHNQVVGAGADLFAACWRRVATSGVKLKMPGWNFELALGTRRLTRLIGQDAARDLLIDTRQMTAEESLNCKLTTDIAETDQWDALISQLLERTRALPQKALEDMLSLTATDTRDKDLASIVHTAGRPGLKSRILSYRSKFIKPAKKSTMVKS